MYSNIVLHFLPICFVLQIDHLYCTWIRWIGSWRISTPLKNSASTWFQGTLLFPTNWFRMVCMCLDNTYVFNEIRLLCPKKFLKCKKVKRNFGVINQINLIKRMLFSILRVFFCVTTSDYPR